MVKHNIKKHSIWKSIYVLVACDQAIHIWGYCFLHFLRHPWTAMSRATVCLTATNTFKLVGTLVELNNIRLFENLVRFNYWQITCQFKCPLDEIVSTYCKSNSVWLRSLPGSPFSPLRPRGPCVPFTPGSPSWPTNVKKNNK